MGNINDTFFDGYYREIWRTVIPDELTVKETDFMLSYFNLRPGSKVLDLMCGYGRHTIALARKGIQVTAVDNLPAYTNEIRETVKRENLPVDVVTGSVPGYKPPEGFDLVVCMGNSLNFFNAGELEKLFSSIAGALKTEGHLLINSWSIAEIVFRNFKDKSWSQIGDMKFLSDAALLFQPTRIETESTIITSEGKTETKKGVDYIFSINELDTMLSAAGLMLREVYSIPGKKKFTIGEPRAYIVAVKK